MSYDSDASGMKLRTPIAVGGERILPARTTLAILYGMLAGLICLGSLFPFDFHQSAATAGRLAIFLQIFRWSDWPDIIGNVLLFFPLGILGAILARRMSKPNMVCVVLTVGGIALAFVLQMLQLYLPSRTAALSDVLTNTIGLMAGNAVGFRAASIFSVSGESAQSTDP